MFLTCENLHIADTAGFAPEWSESPVIAAITRCPHAGSRNNPDWTMIFIFHSVGNSNPNCFLGFNWISLVFHVFEHSFSYQISKQKAYLTCLEEAPDILAAAAGFFFTIDET